MLPSRTGSNPALPLSAIRRWAFVALVALVAMVLPSTALAASYLHLDGTLDGPILFEGSGLTHPYSGIGLGPDTTLTGAYLRDAFLELANLQRADLSGADLRNVWLQSADLSDADFTSANIRHAIFESANLQGANFADQDFFNVNLHFADLRGADLSNAYLLGLVGGTPYYDSTTNFTGAWINDKYGAFDPVAAGWISLNIIPEPGTALLLGLGLAALSRRHRE